MAINQIQKLLKDSVTLSQNQVTRFFKIGAGEYSAHDCFMGITVPTLRKVARQYDDIDYNFLQELLDSKFNEERLLSLLILVSRYKKAKVAEKEKIFLFYLNNLDRVNNWNLVDASAHLIIGAHLLNRDRQILDKLALSSNLWHRRIAIVSTWYFIKNGHTDCTFHIAKTLLFDKEDLIHKATGWMLREAGKVNIDDLIDFLETYKNQMPRTMLRYAIEKFDQTQKDYFMK
ncbi:MAG: DNA alkylation repair protein [Rickettsiales bacterium]|nr:DNA alkylation repair protein [Rickettsiales bacterium]